MPGAQQDNGKRDQRKTRLVRGTDLSHEGLQVRYRTVLGDTPHMIEQETVDLAHICSQASLLSNQ